MPALYLALDVMTAVKEANQGFARKIESFDRQLDRRQGRVLAESFGIELIERRAAENIGSLRLLRM